MASSLGTNKQLVCVLAIAAMLTHLLGLAQPSLAASGNSNPQADSAAASTQPLWSYQVKPGSYVNGAQGAPSAPYSAGPSSLFEAFTGLSQRQGALSSPSPFLSILPIILIAAGGLLLLLPMLTMMMASPFGGGAFGGGGFQNYGGYPQLGLNKRRSLDQLSQGSHRGIIELIEHFSSTIEDLSRKYSPPAAPAQHSPHKRAKALNGHHQAPATGGPNELQSHVGQPTGATAANHKPDAGEPSGSANSLASGP